MKSNGLGLPHRKSQEVELNIATETLRFLAECSKEAGLITSQSRGKLSGMEHRKPVTQSKIALVSVWRINVNYKLNQSVAVNILRFHVQPVHGLLQCIREHHVASDNYMMTCPEDFGSGEPLLPHNLVSPRQIQAMTKMESKHIDEDLNSWVFWMVL